MQLTLLEESLKTEVIRRKMTMKEHLIWANNAQNVAISFAVVPVLASMKKYRRKSNWVFYPM